MYRISDFKGPYPYDTAVTYVETPSGKIPVFEINSFHTLTQFIGLAKYKNKDCGNVYLRGQTSLYPAKDPPHLVKLPPSALRFQTMNVQQRINEYRNHINATTAQTAHFAKHDIDYVEPMLQHYGIRTYWLDVVDNVWIALWFAIHETCSKIIDGREYVHIYEKNLDSYGYILLINSDATEEDKTKPGIYCGSETILCDLRKSIPSYFLRPHAQHALMLKKNSTNPNDFADYSDRIVAIAKISVANALRWIGQTGLLSVQSLFPSPYYDTGYEQLLNEYKVPEEFRDSNKIKNYIKLYGSIQDITY